MKLLDEYDQFAQSIEKNMKAPKVYIISPSELSYRCDHCAHLKHNYELQNKGVSAGITGELDSIQKNISRRLQENRHELTRWRGHRS